jgi:hypothetical protein
MATWPKDYLDLEVPAFIEFGSGQLGEFWFGAVHGWTDYRVSQRDRQPAIEFSWQGVSEGDELSGRGWVTLTDTGLAGHLFIHNSDDSAFRAVRAVNGRRQSNRGGG